MVRILHFVVFFIITFSSLTSEAESNTTKVDIFQELTSKYLNAYNQSNFSSSFATCADLDIKKLSCFVYFKKKNASVPITLIVIKTDTDKYKILLDIINENYFSNEKN